MLLLTWKIANSTNSRPSMSVKKHLGCTEGRVSVSRTAVCRLSMCRGKDHLERASGRCFLNPRRRCSLKAHAKSQHHIGSGVTLLDGTDASPEEAPLEEKKAAPSNACLGCYHSRTIGSRLKLSQAAQWFMATSIANFIHKPRSKPLDAMTGYRYMHASAKIEARKVYPTHQLSPCRHLLISVSRFRLPCLGPDT